MKTRLLYALIALLVVLHLALLVPALQHPSRFQTRDSYDYLDLARTFLSTGRYAGTIYPGVDLVRSPGYPVFVALGLVIGQGQAAAVSVLQVLLLFLSAWLVFAILSQLGNRTAGLATVIILLLNPNAAFWSLLLMSETLAGTMLALAFYALVRFWEKGQRGWLFLAGLALSAGTLVRPIVLPLALLLCLGFFALEWRCTHRPARSLGLSAIFLVGVLVLVLPWQLRNLAVHGQFTLSEVGESTFQNWLAAKTLASAEGYSRDEASAIIAASPNPMRYSLGVITRYPLVFIKEQARGVFRTLLGAEYGTWAAVWTGEPITTTGVLSEFLDQGSLSGVLRVLSSQAGNPWFWAGIYALLYDLALTIAILLGLWRFRYASRAGVTPGLVILVLLAVLYLLLIPGVAGESRFRVPADPLLALLAGLAFSNRVKSSQGNNART